MIVFQVLLKCFSGDETVVVAEVVFFADAMIDKDPGAPRCIKETQVPTPKVAQVVANVKKFFADLFQQHGWHIADESSNFKS